MDVPTIWTVVGLVEISTGWMEEEALSLSLDARVSVSDNQTGNNGKEKKGQQQKIKLN